MEEGNVVAGFGEHFVEWHTDKFAAADEGDSATIELDIVAGEEPVDSSGGSGVEFRMFAEAVDIFVRSDEVAKLVSLRFVGQGELDDNAVN